MKFLSKKVEGLHYLCCEIKGDDQLRSYHSADLCLSFLMQKAGFFITQLIISHVSNNDADQHVHPILACFSDNASQYKGLTWWQSLKTVFCITGLKWLVLDHFLLKTK